MLIVTKANRILSVSLQLLPHPQPLVTKASYNNTNSKRSAYKNYKDSVKQEVF